MIDEEGLQISLPTAEEAADVEGEGAGQGQEYDDENQRHRRREIAA